MSPIVSMSEIDPKTGRRVKSKAPLIVWWKRFEENVLLPEGTSYDNYREQLFGAGYVEYSPALFTELSIIKDWGQNPQSFWELDIHTRAKIVAHNTLKTMLEIRQHHMQLMKERREKKATGNGEN